ncbi:unnamed protein product, partial [Choristocarpus tenellus]
RSKEQDTLDWSVTLAIYFTRCQNWLLKMARFPISNSVLKSSKLNLRLAKVVGKKASRDVYASLGGSRAGGLVGSMWKAVGASEYHSKADDAALLCVKVHVKGVMQSITRDMPAPDIMTFLSYLTTDGNYFPEGFFFEQEKKVLSFDPLGGLRCLSPERDPPESLDATLYAINKSTVPGAKALLLCTPTHHGGLEHHFLPWLHGRIGHSKTKKVGVAEDVTTSTSPSPAHTLNSVGDMSLRDIILWGKTTLPGKLQSVYRHDASGKWYDTSLVEMMLTNYLM